MVTLMESVTYKQADVLALAGGSANELQYALQLGIVVPEKGATASGDHRQFSLQNVVEVAMARELKANGLSPKQLQIVFGQLREKVNALPRELRASATFVRYVEMVDALVTINGPGPNYAQWRKDVSAFMRSWQKKQAPLDDRILNILASARAGEQAAGEKDAR